MATESDRTASSLGRWCAVTATVSMRPFAELVVPPLGHRRPRPRLERRPREMLGEEVRVVLLRDRPGSPTGDPPGRYVDRHRLHHQRLRAGFGGGRAPGLYSEPIDAFATPADCRPSAA